MGKYLITNTQRTNVEFKIDVWLADLKATICFDGGTGRRRGLKHHCRKGVRVQIPLEAPLPKYVGLSKHIVRVRSPRAPSSDNRVRIILHP